MEEADRAQGPALHLAEQVVELLRQAARPLTAARVRTRVESADELSLETVTGLLEGLAAAGRIHRLPKLPGKRTVRYSLHPPRPEEYLRPHVKRIRELADELAEAGVPVSDTLRAARTMLAAPAPPAVQTSTPPPPDKETPEPAGDQDDELLLRRIAEKQSVLAGKSVSVRDLRHSLDWVFADKGSFDRAMLRLRDREQVVLERDEHPDDLTQAERDALVTDGEGNYYSRVKLRR